MRLTQEQLNRATLARQMLLDRERLSVTEAVRRMVAIQAQEAASPYVALWNRVHDFDPAHVDEAYVDQQIVKASLMRITLHTVHIDDYALFHEAMVASLRASRLYDRRYTSTGLTVADADAAVESLLEFASEPRTSAEMEAFLEKQHGARSKWLWWALKTFAPFTHAPTTPPWTFGQRPSYRPAPTLPTRPDRETALQHLIRRYLGGFGPATARDFGQFSLQPQSAIKPALAVMADELVTYESPGGEVLYDVPGAPIPEASTSAPPRLLAMWESILLAYRDRSRIIPEEYRSSVIRRNGDVLPTVLVDGRVVGVWRPAEAGIEVTAFCALASEAWDGLATEAARLIDFLEDRDPNVYGRFGRWWSDLDGADVRVIGV